MLTKLTLEGNVWLAADMHLGPHNAKTASAFYQFLQQAKQQANALILCGDIFNAWVGADIALDPPSWLGQAIYHFRDTALDIPIYFMRGNRDFLLDARFAKYVGATLLDDQVLLQTEHHQTLLTHGDELCTDDKAYQSFRRKVRHPTLQKLFLKLPLTWRQRIAGDLRKKSQATQKKRSDHTKNNNDYRISDVNEGSCIELLELHQQTVLIHGHTHRPALHRMQNESNQSYSRLVLPDWEYDHSQPTRAGWLILQADGQMALHRLHHPTLRFKLKN